MWRNKGNSCEQQIRSHEASTWPRYQTRHSPWPDKIFSQISQTRKKSIATKQFQCDKIWWLEQKCNMVQCFLGAMHIVRLTVLLTDEKIGMTEATVYFPNVCFPTKIITRNMANRIYNKQWVLALDLFVTETEPSEDLTSINCVRDFFLLSKCVSLCFTMYMSSASLFWFYVHRCALLNITCSLFI